MSEQIAKNGIYSSNNCIKINNISNIRDVIKNKPQNIKLTGDLAKYFYSIYHIGFLPWIVLSAYVYLGTSFSLLKKKNIKPINIIINQQLTKEEQRKYRSNVIQYLINMTVISGGISNVRKLKKYNLKRLQNNVLLYK